MGENLFVKKVNTFSVYCIVYSFMIFAVWISKIKHKIKEMIKNIYVSSKIVILFLWLLLQILCEKNSLFYIERNFIKQRYLKK